VLVDLGDAAVEAGTVYVHTETGVSRSLLVGPW
jgi:hypothetical protein